MLVKYIDLFLNLAVREDCASLYFYKSRMVVPISLSLHYRKICNFFKGKKKYQL